MASKAAAWLLHVDLDHYVSNKLSHENNGQ